MPNGTKLSRTKDPQRRRGSRKRGGVLIATLVLVMSIGAISVCLLELDSSRTRRQVASIDNKLAFNLAEAGLAEACFGLSTGRTGNVGSPTYMNYTIIGDTVNVASRLGQRARAGEMLFSDAVKTLLDQRGIDVGAMPLPSLVLRGRSSPIGIFCVPSGVDHRIDFRPN